MYCGHARLCVCVCVCACVCVCLSACLSARRIWEVGAAGWPVTGGVVNITAAAWTPGFQWWRSGNITRTQNVSEYMLVLALCLVSLCY